MINTHYRQATIIDEVKGIIRGYIAIWGSPEHRDSYETYFDKERPPELGLDFLPIPLIYEHGFDGGVKKEIIGSVTRAWFDDIGVAFEGKLDNSSEAFTRFVNEIRSGKLCTSSATSEHLAEFDTDGRFVRWILSELSLTASPAEEQMPAVQLMRTKLAHDALDKSHGEISENERKHTRQGNGTMLEAILAALGALPPDASPEQIIQVLTDAGLSAEDFAAIQSELEVPKEGRQEGEGGEGDTPATEKVVTAVEEVVAAVKVVLEEKGAEEAVMQLEEARSKANKLTRENLALKMKVAGHRSREQEPAKDNGIQRHAYADNGGQISDMKELKFDHLNSREMAYGYMLLKSRGKPVSDDYIRSMAGKTIELVDKGYGAFKDPTNYQSLRSSIRNAKRADELVYTANTGYGLEWIPENWQTQLWETARQGLVMDTLMSRMMVVEASGQPGSVVYIPLEGSDPTFYKGAEATDVGADLEPKPLVDSSRLGTAQVAVTPGKGMSRVIVSTEMLEDSIVPVLSQLDKQFNQAFGEEIEYLALNGDTTATASTNINLIDGTPATGTSAPSYLITNGMLMYALVTGSSTSSDGGALTSGDFLDARGLMPNNLISDPAKLVYISDNSTMLKALALSDWKDISVSLAPTQERGVLTQAWGSPYLGSGQMAVAYTDGKISATAGNNTKGRLLCIAPQYWAMVWKRKVTFKTFEDIDTDTTKVVSSFRVAFQYRSAGASTCIYNLTV